MKRGLSASFFQADGSSRPGVDWAVELANGTQTLNVIVRTYPENADDASRAPAYLAHAALSRVVQWLDEGWDPSSFRLDQVQAASIVVPTPPK